jgi:hypothetical protein
MRTCTSWLQIIAIAAPYGLAYHRADEIGRQEAIAAVRQVYSTPHLHPWQVLPDLKRLTALIHGQPIRAIQPEIGQSAGRVAGVPCRKWLQTSSTCSHERKEASWISARVASLPQAAYVASMLKSRMPALPFDVASLAKYLHVPIAGINGWVKRIRPAAARLFRWAQNLLGQICRIVHPIRLVPRSPLCLSSRFACMI